MSDEDKPDTSAEFIAVALSCLRDEDSFESPRTYRRIANTLEALAAERDQWRSICQASQTSSQAVCNQNLVIAGERDEALAMVERLRKALDAAYCVIAGVQIRTMEAAEAENPQKLQALLKSMAALLDENPSDVGRRG